MSEPNLFVVYLVLEELMKKLDEHKDPFADQVRDLMDKMWYRLSEEEYKFLDGRSVKEVRDERE